MTLSRWRRIATGIAAGVIVLCAALIGASFRSDSTGVSVASELRPANVIPIKVDPDDDAADQTADDDGNSVTVIEADDLPDDEAATDDGDTSDADAGDPNGTTSDVPDTTDPANDIDANEGDANEGDANEGDTSEPDTSEPDTSDAGDQDEPLTEPVDVTNGDTASTTSTDTAEPDAAAAPPAPASNGETLGTGGGVDGAECALDRLVIYAGARVGGVAGSLRSAIAQSGFAAGCAQPVTILASNCPLQFAGVLGAGSGYDPSQSFVASSSNVDRETLTSVVAAIGYSGNSINILDFGFVNPDQPGEQWIAIFVPPSFSGWETLANRAGLAPSTQSLCAPSGTYQG